MDGEISVDELATLVDGSQEDRPRIVDIRNADAYARGHIPGSENIPAATLTDRVEELDGAGRVVTVCPHGKASVQAARLIASYEGVDGPVESLAGGLEAWDGPLENGTAAETDESDASDRGDSTAPF